MNNILLVKDEDLELIKAWPLDLRAIFNDAADRELAQRIAEEKRGQATVARSWRINNEQSEYA